MLQYVAALKNSWMFWDSVYSGIYAWLSVSLETWFKFLYNLLWSCVFFPAILGGLQLRGYIIYPTNEGMPPEIPSKLKCLCGSRQFKLPCFNLLSCVFVSRIPLATQFNILFCMILSCILGICLIFGDDTLRLCLRLQSICSSILALQASQR